MNKSKYINPRSCRTCGICCKTFSLCYLKENEEIMLSEVKRFELLDTDKIEIIELKDRFLVKFNFPCRYLEKKNGMYRCTSYNDRPKLCEEYPYEDSTDCPYMGVKNGKQKS